MSYQSQQLQQRKPVLGQLGADQTNQPLAVLQNTLVDVEPPRGHGLVCHDLLEADCETFLEESLAMFTLSIQFSFAKFDAILQKNF